MQEFLKVMELNYRLSHQLTDSEKKRLQLKLDNLPIHYFFIDFDWLSCAI